MSINHNYNLEIADSEIELEIRWHSTEGIANLNKVNSSLCYPLHSFQFIMTKLIVVYILLHCQVIH